MSIDFTNCNEIINDFGGSEKKKKIIYNNEIYMMKFPDPVKEKNNELSYMNNQFSEYVGCHIFELCGINAQKTMLGTYLDKETNKLKVVVACRSFENDGYKLVEFNKFLLSSNIDSKSSEKLDLKTIINIFNNDNRINAKENIEAFYKTILIDILIGNEDRHEENFAFIYKNNIINPNKLVYSPIYDCGSSLSPLLSDERMEQLLINDVEFKAQEYNLKLRYYMNGERVFMHQFVKNAPKMFNDILLDNFKKINIDEINNLIDNTEYMSNIRKEYFKKSIKIRYDLILSPAYKNLIKNNIQTNSPKLTP